MVKTKIENVHLQYFCGISNWQTQSSSLAAQFHRKAKTAKHDDSTIIIILSSFPANHSPFLLFFILIILISLFSL